MDETIVNPLLKPVDSVNQRRSVHNIGSDAHGSGSGSRNVVESEFRFTVKLGHGR